MLCGLFVVKQPTVLDGLTFDPFPFQQNGLIAPEVDVGRGEIVDALVVAVVIVVVDEGRDLGFEITGMFPVTRDRDRLGAIEFDCVLRARATRTRE